MRVFLAALGAETNTFSPIDTDLHAFAEGGLYRGDASARDQGAMGAVLRTWQQAAAASGQACVEGLAAYAPPGAPVRAPAYASLRAELLDGLRRAMPVDVVLLLLHGAMMAEGEDDCEGDLLAAVREIVGDAVVGAVLDLHGNLSRRMVRAADVLISYKEYPHTDILARAAQLFALCQAAAGGTRFGREVYDCRMIGLWPTTSPGMRALVARMMAAEGQGAAVSFLHGFPWADAPDMGAKVLVCGPVKAQGQGRAQARQLALSLGRAAFAVRETAAPRFMPLAEALSRLQPGAAGRPLVLAEVADNPDGGAAADGTHVLRHLLAEGVDGALCGLFFEPEAAARCVSAGVGAALPLRLGGRQGAPGGPLDLRATVRAIAREQDVGWPLGNVIWVTCEGIDLLIGSKRRALVTPRIFAPLGVDPRARRLLLVKAAGHCHQGFSPLASEIVYLDTPGTCAPDFAALPLRRVGAPRWPKEADPFGGDPEAGLWPSDEAAT
jgi:microcystin degradation protein MlrC